MSRKGNQEEGMDVDDEPSIDGKEVAVRIMREESIPGIVQKDCVVELVGLRGIPCTITCAPSDIFFFVRSRTSLDKLETLDGGCAAA